MLFEYGSEYRETRDGFPIDGGVQQGDTMKERMDASKMIDANAPRWGRWGSMLRSHPDALLKILNRLPRATCETDSLYKTAAIFSWLKILDVEMINLVSDEYYGVMPRHTFSFYIAFQDSPYKTHPEVPGIGRSYVDPDFEKIPADKSSAEITAYLLRNEDNALIRPWLENIQQAERAYFNEDTHAPVCTLEWSAHDSYSNKFNEPTHKWDATQEILNMPVGSRRSISGHRSHDPFPLSLSYGAPKEVLDHHLEFNLVLAIHTPSDMLIAHRSARNLSNDTLAVDRTAMRRTL